MVDLSDGVDPGDVLAIFDGDASTAAVEFWITAAEDLVDERLDAGEFDGDTLARITLLVACHNLAAQQPTESKGSVGPATFSYEGVREPDAHDAGLAETRYGRRALSLDGTGGLEASEEPFVFETYGV
jgi:hypothetical protein